MIRWLNQIIGTANETLLLFFFNQNVDTDVEIYKLAFVIFGGIMDIRNW